MRRLLIVGGLLAVLLAGVVSLYASAQPDGLNRVAEDQGIAASQRDSVAAGSVFADYSVSGLGDGRAGGAVAGLAGVAVTAVLGFGFFHLVRVRRS